LTAGQVAERAGMSRMTLRSLERGGSGVTIGAYLGVMQVLGIEKDLDLLGMADPLGRELQDAAFPTHTRGKVRTSPIFAGNSAQVEQDLPREETGRLVVEHERSRETLENISRMGDPTPNAQQWLNESREARRLTGEKNHIGEMLSNLKHAGLPTADVKKWLKEAEEARRWIEKGGFADSTKLADLIDSTKSISKWRR